MDVESILESCTVLSVDLFLLGLFYKLHKQKASCLQELKDATQMEMNNELLKNVQDLGGAIPYAVICGKVKALARPIQSNGVRGVIKVTVTNEYKMKWIPALADWVSSVNDIKRQVTVIPFCLTNKTGLFRKSISVQVADPLTAEELVLTEVNNNFTSYKESFGETILGFFTRERTIGIKEVENMLLENTPLTAIGKLTIQNDTIQIGTPDSGSTYFLTPLTYNALIEKITVIARVYKGLTIFMSVVTGVLLSYFCRRIFREVMRRIAHERDMRKIREARKKRMLDSNLLASSDTGGNDPKCVICLENPIHTVILECGHACLCFSCSEQILNNCPVCRAPVERLLPVYMP